MENLKHIIDHAIAHPEYSVGILLLLIVVVIAVAVLIVRLIKKLREDSLVNRARKSAADAAEIGERSGGGTEEAFDGSDYGALKEQGAEDGSFKSMPHAEPYGDESANAETEERFAEVSPAASGEMAEEEEKGASPEVSNEPRKGEKGAKKTKTKKPENTDKNKTEETVMEEKEVSVKGKTANAVYRVIYDSENKEWMVKKDGAQRVIRRTRTKTEAVDLAKKFSENQDLALSVQKKDGKFQKKSSYERRQTKPGDKGGKK